MSKIISGFSDMIYRHNIAFAISLTLAVIGIFAGMFYAAGGGESAELYAEAVRSPNIATLFFGMLIPSGAAVFAIYLAGLFRVPAYCIIPCLLIYKGADTGIMWMNALDGFKGFIELAIIYLPAGAVMALVYITAGMAGFCIHSKGTDYPQDSYNSLFIFLIIMDLAACLYYTMVKYLFSLI